MRVVLVGSALDRARIRAALGDASIDVVGEAPTLADAHALEADAIIMAHGDREGSETDEPLSSDDALDADDPVYREPLTPREIEVLELLAEGLANKAIAARLGISDQTVKFHVSSIYGKLGAANRTDAVRRAVRRGLIAL
jgi:DNA-binding CsgD family transcriptional regulator